MWQNWLSGILGLWIILLVFLGFSSTLTGFFLVVSGLALAGLGFWSASLTKPPPKSHPESEILPESPAGGPDLPEDDSVSGVGESSSQDGAL
jgi:hypothetical protein